MAEIVVTFADGAQERLPAGTTAGDALRLHAERNGTGRKELRRAVAARVDEAGGARVIDLGRPLVGRLSRDRGGARLCRTGWRCCGTRAPT